MLYFLIFFCEMKYLDFYDLQLFNPPVDDFISGIGSKCRWYKETQKLKSYFFCSVTVVLHHFWVIKMMKIRVFFFKNYPTFEDL